MGTFVKEQEEITAELLKIADLLKVASLVGECGSDSTHELTSVAEIVCDKLEEIIDRQKRLVESPAMLELVI
ncbi:MAG: hypothetical protein LBL34_02445 [Clostridiales bacterium]|jgi:hypothetical protein|nr:hypothetical protein [Clostridiales bacterium]